jgi:hypothetical protein
MDVLIRLDHGEPPVGTVVPLGADDAIGADYAIAAVPFVGWLGLLRALSNLIGQAEGRLEH